MEKIGGKLYLTHLGRRFWFPVPGPSAGHKENTVAVPFPFTSSPRLTRPKRAVRGLLLAAPPPPRFSLPELQAQTSIFSLPSVLPPFSFSQSPASFS